MYVFLQGTKRKRNSNKNKIPKKKRAPSAYILFSVKTREDIKLENPTLPFGDIARLVSERWTALSSLGKQVPHHTYCMINTWNEMIYYISIVNYICVFHDRYSIQYANYYFVNYVMLI